MAAAADQQVVGCFQGAECGVLRQLRGRIYIYLRACGVGGWSVGHGCLQYQNAVDKRHGDVSDPVLACAAQNEGQHAIRAGL